MTKDEKIAELAKIEIEAMTTFYDKQEQWLIDQMIQDMRDNPEKYKGAVVYPIEREKVIDLIKKGQNAEQHQNQKAIECLKEVRDRLHRFDKAYKLKPTDPATDLMYKIDNYCENKIIELEGENEKY